MSDIVKNDPNFDLKGKRIDPAVIENLNKQFGDMHVVQENEKPKHLLETIEGADIIDAFHDSARDLLTGLYNRRELKKRMNDLTGKFAMVMIDIDNFKSVNDKYNHSVGDKLLKHLSLVIQKNIKSDDLAVRYGGEEFVIVLPGEITESDLEERAKKILSEFSNSFIRHGAEKISRTLSMGATITNNNEDWESVLNRADTLMYDVKKTTKNGVKIG